MNVNDATRKGHPIVFGTLVLIALIEMCIAAWITARYNANQNFPSSGFRTLVQFMLFASIWTAFFGSMYLALVISMPSSHITGIFSHFLFLFVTWIFWLIATIVLTQSLGGKLDCHTEEKFVYCGQLNALDGFSWLILAVLTVMVVFVLLRGISKRREGVNSPMVEV